MKKEDPKKLIPDNLLKSLKELENDKNETIKRGDNVLHLEFLGELSEEELKEIETKITDANLELSYYNKSGIPYASLEEYSLVTFFIINQALLLEILKNAGMNATWDVIKWSLKYGWNKLRGKKFNKYQGGKLTEKETKFGFTAQLDKNTSINLELSGHLDNEQIETVLDKVLGFIEKRERNQSYKTPNYAMYDKINEEWVEIDVMEEIRKKSKKKNKMLDKIIKQKKKKKKGNKKDK
ncbi:hypothetical protein [Kordia sp.]|uniref:hypothetical protein n=1 Tax=Kordia sp. TaxID=1965332 RepID=UPI003D2E186C